MMANYAGSNDLGRTGTNVPTQIFVGGLPPWATECDLQETFVHYGHITATKLITDGLGQSKGYGFVTFGTENEARTAIMEAQGVTLGKRKLTVAQANGKLESGQDSML